MSHRTVSQHPANRLRRSAASMAVLNLLALALNQPAQAMNAYWAGGEGNWMSNIAWVDGLVPNYYLDRVFIDDLINPASTSKVHLNTSVGVGQVFIGAGDELRIEQGSLSLYGGVLSNKGTLTIAGSPYTGSASLGLAANTMLTGNGNTVLTDSNYSYVYGGGHTLTIDTGHTLRGAGYIGADGSINVVNKGSVIAEGAGKTLNLQLGSSNTFNNTAGTVTVADGATLYLVNGTFSGGTVAGQGDAQLAGAGTFANTSLFGTLSTSSGSSFVLKDATLAGQLKVAAGTSVKLQGTVTNNGTLNVLGSGGYATGSLRLTADTTLAGSGNTVLTDSNYSYVYGGGHTLTIDTGHTLRGAGYIGADGSINVVNKGSVIAEGAGKTLNLQLGSSNTFNNTAGTVTIADGATLYLVNGTFSGGTVAGQGDARLAGGGTFANTSLTGPLTVAAGTSINLQGTIANNGTLNVLGSGGYATGSLRLTADTTLAGSGNTVLTDSNYSYVYGGGHTLTIDAGHTLRGAGYIGADGSINVVNKGSVIAEGGALNLYLGGGTRFDNTLGTVGIDETGTITVSGALLMGDASLLSFDIANNTGAAELGLMTFNSAPTFDGTLHLNFEGYTPTIGEQFRLIDFSGSYAGAFDAATSNGYTLSLSYANTEVVATVTGVSAVPEPETYALLLSGLAVVGWRARRLQGRHV